MAIRYGAFLRWPLFSTGVSAPRRRNDAEWIDRPGAIGCTATMRMALKASNRAMDLANRLR